MRGCLRLSLLHAACVRRARTHGGMADAFEAGAGNGFGKALVKAVTAGTLRVHVHLRMQLHMNKVMIRIS